MAYSFFLGVDPGKSGGLVVLDREGSIVSKAVMPVRTDGSIDSDGVGQAIPSLVIGLGDDVLPIVEKVWSMPGQGVCSMFTFGRVTGQVIGALEVYLGRRVHEVAPQSWQRGLWGPAEDPKAAAREFAERNWPEETFLATRRSRKPHQGLVDAACLAEWGRRNARLYEGD